MRRGGDRERGLEGGMGWDGMVEMGRRRGVGGVKWSEVFGREEGRSE